MRPDTPLEYRGVPAPTLQRYSPQTWETERGSGRALQFFDAAAEALYRRASKIPLRRNDCETLATRDWMRVS